MIQKEQKELCITILIVIAAFGILFVFADFRNENMGQITAMFVKEPEGVKVNSVDSGNLGSITGLIIEEVSGKEIEGYIKEASKAYGIPENLIKAHITAESNFNPRAVAIGCGAAGLIQLMPGTAKQLGLKTFNNYDFVTCNAGKTEELLNFMAGKSLKEIALVDERFDPKKNIMAGEKYLKQQIDKFNGDIELGLAAYNAGPGAVNKRCCSDGSCVKFAECKSRLPQETQNYVEKIMRLSGEDIKVLPKYSYSTGEDIIKEDGKIYIIRTIGTYSVNPSFVVRESYNIGDYELIKQQFLGYGNNKGVLDLVAECEKKDEKKNVEECVKEAVIEVNEREEMKSNGLVLFNGPCNAKENIWSDFIEDFGDCLENKEDNCYCEISLNQSEQTAFKDEIRIKVEKNQGTVIKLDDKDNPLSYIFQKEIENEKTLNIKVKDSTYYLLKENGKVLLQENKPSMLKCAIEKRKFKFCVNNTAKKILYYDESKKKAEHRNIEYKFAIEFPDTIPPAPVTGFLIEDKPKGEESFIVRWNKNKEADIGKYVIYFAESSYDVFVPQLDLNAIKQNTALIKFEIDLAHVQKKEVSADDVKDYSLLVPGILYHIKTNTEDGFLYVLEKKSYKPYHSIIKDNIEYDFSITAVDIFGNEINNIDEKQKLPIIKNVKSIDNLAPEQPVITNIAAIDGNNIKIDFLWPTYNIDGTELVDLEKIRVYYNNALLTEFNAVDLNCQFTCSITIENKGRGGYSLTAVDEAGNEFNNLEPFFFE